MIIARNRCRLCFLMFFLTAVEQWRSAHKGVK